MEYVTITTAYSMAFLNQTSQLSTDESFNVCKTSNTEVTFGESVLLRV